MSHSNSPDREAAQQYRRDAARVRALADAAYVADVRNDLVAIADDYEALAQQRDAAARRYGDGLDEPAGVPRSGISHPRGSPGRRS